MFTILGADGKEYGPVSTAKVQEWMLAGRANAETKIRRAGETEWSTLGQMPEFGPPLSAGAPPAPSPAPAPVASSAPALPVVATGVDAKAFAADLIARAAPLDVLSCIGRSFELWKNNLLPLVGVTFVVLLLLGFLGMIPILGIIVNLIMTGVFYGGLYYYYFGKMRGEPREFGDAFKGFSMFGPLALSNLMVTLLTGLAAVVLIAPWMIPIVLVNNGTLSQTALFIAIPGIIVCILPVIFLAVAWSFTYALVIDYGLSPWTAMEVSRRVITKQWLRVFFTVFLGGILSILGVVGLVIGIVFTLPLGIGAILYAYEDLCRPPPRV